jgi:hypothetical protein
MASVESRLTRLEEQMATVMAGRPGRRPLPVTVSEEGVCGVDPDSDSASCPHASLYRRQKGCLGTACQAKTDEYYANYRSQRRGAKKNAAST